MSEPDSFELPMWTIYKSPADYPGVFVVRRCRIMADQIVHDLSCLIADTLDIARAMVPEGLINLGRMPDDDPAIVEVWV